MKDLLTLKNVCLTLGGIERLDGISMALCSGEILGVAGSNGAGKTSLTRICSGELKPSTGDILYAGRPLSALSSLLRACALAVLPQRSDLRFDFTVTQVVEMGVVPHVRNRKNSVTPDLLRASIENSLHRWDLHGLKDRPYPALSGGEQQRVHLARSEVQLLAGTSESSLEGQVLILDEPTSSLDLRFQELLLDWICLLRNRGAAVLLVMHDLSLLSRCADRLLLLKGGSTQALGATANVLREDVLSDLYGHPLRLLHSDEYGGVFVVPDAIKASSGI